jgi:hypothetical protein
MRKILSDKAPLKFCWESSSTSKEVGAALRVLAEEYPLAENGRGGVPLRFRKVRAKERVSRVGREGAAVVVEHSDLAGALRGVGSALSGLVPAEEKTSFTSLGIMLDCSRNAVMTAGHFKGWLRKLSLLGYSTAMLYTEDTYELPGEPYFGYLRGAYTEAELKEIDAYAASLGIEMVGCIQTLGHLQQALKWSVYQEVKDTSSVLLVGAEKTYALIDKMIGFWSRVFKSRRLHVGMDETHDLGRGRYLDLFGHKRGFELFNEHLAQVVGICRRHQVSPMLWSDMYFRLGSKTMDYYDTNCVIPREVVKKIPQEAALVYWDYYHDNEAFYLDYIKRHRDLGSEPLMGSGVWTWNNFWYDQQITERTVEPCIHACLKAKVKELFFTLWGDDGAFCDFDSALAGLAWSAELAYAGTTDPRRLQRRFAAVCHASYRDVLLPCNQLPTELFWDDPLLGIHWKNALAGDPRFWAKRAAGCRAALRKLEKADVRSVAGGDLAHIRNGLKLVVLKVALHQALDAAYAKRDLAALGKVRAAVPAVVAAVQAFDASFSTQWRRRNKPFGLEVIQSRFATQVRRYQELAARLDELLKGRCEGIEELDARPVSHIGVNGSFSQSYSACATTF